jgi:hypothetical protein
MYEGIVAHPFLSDLDFENMKQGLLIDVYILLLYIRSLCEAVKYKTELYGLFLDVCVVLI